MNECLMFMLNSSSHLTFQVRFAAYFQIHSNTRFIVCVLAKKTWIYVIIRLHLSEGGVLASLRDWKALLINACVQKPNMKENSISSNIFFLKYSHHENAE